MARTSDTRERIAPGRTLRTTAPLLTTAEHPAGLVDSSLGNTVMSP